MRNYGSISLDGSFSIVAENKAEGDMHLKGAYNIIAGNSFSTIYMENAHSNIICNNSLLCLWVGFYGHTCSNNTICKNKFTGPGIWGISMGTGAYNVFHDNLISNYKGEYSGYGIALGGYGQIAENNMFYRNIFINNNRHVSTNWEVLGAGNYWDNGKEGNYWDDYSGTDADGDGIGDTPYIVKGVIWDENVRGHVEFVFGQDNYPLMSPFDINTISMELPEWALTILNASPEPKPNQSSPPNPLPDPNLTPQTQMSEPFPLTWTLAAAGSVVAILIGIAFKFAKIKKNNKQVAR
ncbi:MAG: NosD domain-containing protein, partial [Candidatus Bathyarchaeia archaeon]